MNGVKDTHTDGSQRPRVVTTIPKKFTTSYNKAAEDPDAIDDGVKTIGDCLRLYANTQGDKNAMVFAPTVRDGVREVITYSEMYQKSCDVAKSLIALGLKQGEIIAINIRQCPEWLLLCFGAMMMGAKVAAIAFTYKDGSDLIAIMGRLQTCALIAVDPGADGTNWEIVQKFIETHSKDGHVSSSKMPYLRYLIGTRFPPGVDGIKTIQDLIRGNHPNIELPPIQADDVTMLFQTSGSTGVPKLVAHTHRSMLCLHRLGRQEVVFGEELIYFFDRPFGWVGGFPFNLLTGQTRVTISGFGPQILDVITRVVEVICEEKCQVSSALPPRLNALINMQEKLPSDWPLKVIVTGGQPITKTIAKAVGIIGDTLVCVYGATEMCSPFEYCVSHPDDFVEYACGKPMTGSGIEAKIVADDGAILPVNTRGELFVRSPGLFKEYLNDPVKTAEVLSQDGWYKTDDLARMNECGEFFIEGRKSNMILSGGFNVSPEILERVLKACPGVATAIIVPVPDAVLYQVVCACVIVKKGCQVTEDDVRRYCEGIYNDKPGVFTVLPKFYMFVESFPLTYTGKTSRKDLTTMAKARFT